MLRETRSFASAPLTPSFQPFRLAALTPKTYLEIHEQFESSINPESLQKLKQSILDIWQCVINNVARIPEPDFSNNDKLSLVLQYVINTFERVKHPDSNYIFDKNDDGWYIREFKEVSCGDGINGAAIATNFFPIIENKNPLLYDLLMNTFIFMRQKTGMDYATINQRSHYGEFVLERFDQVFEEQEQEPQDMDIALYKTSLQSHKSGNINQIYKLINSKRPITVDSLRKQMKSMNKKLLFKYGETGNLYGWLNRLINLLEIEAYNVDEFNYSWQDPDCNDGYPIFYSDTIGFYWHAKDPYFIELDQIYNDSSNQIGVVDPCWYKHWHLDRTVGEISASNWPAEFFNLCKEFNTDIHPLIEKAYGITDNNY